MKTEHTPLPWKIGPVVGSRKIFSDDSVIAEAWPTTINLDEARANAAFILKACNSHYALVEACKAACRAASDCLPPSGEGELDAGYYKAKLLAIDEAASQCSLALALAEKGNP